MAARTAGEKNSVSHSRRRYEMGHTGISKGASTVVLGNRHVHGLARFLLGSVSHTMILDIQVPTIIVSARYEI